MFLIYSVMLVVFSVVIKQYNRYAHFVPGFVVLGWQ